MLIKEFVANETCMLVDFARYVQKRTPATYKGDRLGCSSGTWRAAYVRYREDVVTGGVTDQTEVIVREVLGDWFGKENTNG